MADVLVRHIDDETKRRLAVRAAANGRSMQAEMLHILTQATLEEPRAAVEPSRAGHKRPGPSPAGMVAFEGGRPATAFGILHAHADAAKIPLEKEAWAQAAAHKHRHPLSEADTADRHDS